MKSILLLAGPGLLALTLTACTPGDRFTVGGVPGWLASGAIIEDEPEPFRPDPAIIMHESESDALNFELITDRKVTETEKAAKKKASKPASDPIERGRDRRIKRLFR